MSWQNCGDHRKSFVSEEEVQEQRQRRQEQWDKVRQPDDPVECPEEETRSLFDQLQANKELKEREHEEETKLRSSVKGLDDDEVQFLNFVSDRQVQLEKDRNKEEKSLIEEMKMASVIKVQEKKEPDQSVCESVKSAASTSNKNSQKLLLQGAIKRKSTETESGEKKQKVNNEEAKERPDAKLMAGITPSDGYPVVAGILPGIAGYADDDSSTENESNSSDSEADHMIMPSAPTQRLIQEMVQRLNEMKEGGCG